MKSFKELEVEFKEKQSLEKQKIKAIPNKAKRMLYWGLYLCVFPFKWLWVNIRDYRTAIIFVIVFIVVSSEVWVPYLIGVICWANEPVRISMFSFGSACWLFWLGPGTPFLVICIGLTIGVKALFNKIKYRRKKAKENSD